jgi:predicted DCC family thiol-disulfide oxidoreductase YuxK
MNAQQRLASMHVLCQGRVLSGGRAAAEVAGALRALEWLPGAVEKSPLLARAADATYGLVAHNRHRLGRLVRDVPPVSRSD